MLMGMTGCGATEEGGVEEAAVQVKETSEADSKTTDKVLEKVETMVEKTLGNGAFEMGKFTSSGDGYTTNLSDDIEEHLGEEEVYMDFLGASMIPLDDLMRIVNIELEYVMQMDTGTWSDKESEHPNGGGKTVSTMAQSGDLYTYTVSYQYTTGRYKDIVVQYDSTKDRADYHSLSYGDDGSLEEENWQQFCNDGNHGYFYQSLLQDHRNMKERASYQYFTETDYHTYLKSSSEGYDINGLTVDIFKTIPKSVEELVTSDVETMMIQNISGTFAYEVTEE